MSDTHILALVDTLDVNAAGPLAHALLELRGQPVTLDASQVRRIGGQCLQVLLSAEATWAVDGQAFDICSPSSDFADGLAQLGASRLCDVTSPSFVQD